MKRITEAELHSEFALRDRSRSAMLAFGCGLLGCIICIIVFFMTDRYLREVKDYYLKMEAEQFNMTWEETEAAKEQIKDKTVEFFDLAMPLFLGANALWIIGGYAWSLDLRRNPANKYVWKLGGLLVLTTAVACAIAWYFLIQMGTSEN